MTICCWEIKTIEYAEERSIHAASNYYGVSRLTIRYWIKEKEELVHDTKNEHCYIA